jgi:hypothetical protein
LLHGNIPFEIVKHILSYDKRIVIRNEKIIQINSILINFNRNDKRYELLLYIPLKEYNTINNITYLYLTITNDKDYFITYKNYEIQIIILLFSEKYSFFKFKVYNFYCNHIVLNYFFTNNLKISKKYFSENNNIII